VGAANVQEVPHERTVRMSSATFGTKGHSARWLGYQLAADWAPQVDPEMVADFATTLWGLRYCRGAASLAGSRSAPNLLWRLGSHGLATLPHPSFMPLLCLWFTSAGPI
jgi:hypothetical protein